MKREEMQKSFVQKLERLRKLVYGRLPQLDGRDLLQIMGKLAHFHYNKKKFIVLGEEKGLYDLLIEKGYNPFTVYRWLLLERVPTDIKFQIKQKKISQKRAVSEALKRRQERFDDVTLAIREHGLSLIARM